MYLKYGSANIDVPVENWNPFIIQKSSPPHTIADTQAIQKAFLNHLQETHFYEFLNPNDSVAILIPDKTRYAMADHLLPVLLNEIEHLGIPLDQVQITFALGIHTPQTPEEQISIIGEEVSRRVAYRDHNALTDELIDYGSTSNGTPVLLNKRVMEKDKIIVLGTITYHYFAGFGGGRKMFIPGIANAAASRSNHILALTETGRHPAASTGNLNNNPVYEDAIEALSLIPRNNIFTINVVQTPNKELLRFFSGDIITSHKDACQFYHELFQVTLPAPVDLAVVSAGGAPKDINWIQSHKAVEMAYRVIRPGGTILAFLECPQGTGHNDFLRWFDYPTLGEHRQALNEHYQIYGQTAWNTRFKAEQCKILLHSELPADVIHKMGMHPVDSIDLAISQINAKYKNNPTVAVFPHGSMFLPIISEK